MSNRSGQTSRMKNILNRLKIVSSQHVVARFGSAKLVKDEQGKLRLRGGSKAEKVEAREWISFFMHEGML